MRLLKVITSALAVVFSVVAGLVATAVIALAGVAIVLIARLLGRRASRAPRSAPRARIGRAGGEIIDISATEVSAERPSR